MTDFTRSYLPVPDGIGNRRLQPSPRAAHLDMGAVARALGEFEAIDGAVEGRGRLFHHATVLGGSPERHGVSHLNALDGQFFPVCVCGAPGRGFLTADRARQFECPRQMAEIEIAANLAEYERAVAFVSSGPRR